jgi:hypothetical protein
MQSRLKHFNSHCPPWRLIASAQNRYLEDLERTSKDHARALSVAAEKAIAENAATGVAKVVAWGRSQQTSATAPKAAAPAVKKAKHVRG